MRKELLFLLLCVFVAFQTFAWGSEEAPTDYRVGEGDVLQVMVYDHPDLTTVVRVDNGGVVLFPLLGPVKIGGMSVGQVSDHLAKKLSDGYIINPQVSVFVQEFRSKKVTVVGQVALPGLYELSGPTTLLEVISKAGGLRPEAGDKIVVQRKTGTEGERQIVINRQLLMEQGDTSLDIPLRDGDNVFIAQAGTFYVTGQVNKPAAYRLDEGATVIKGITMAGGFTGLASTKKVRIIRKEKGSERVLENVSMHELIRPDDVIVVPESFF